MPDSLKTNTVPHSVKVPPMGQEYRPGEVTHVLRHQDDERKFNFLRGVIRTTAGDTRAKFSVPNPKRAPKTFTQACEMVFKAHHIGEPVFITNAI